MARRVNGETAAERQESQTKSSISAMTESGVRTGLTLQTLGEEGFLIVKMKGLKPAQWKGHQYEGGNP